MAWNEPGGGKRRDPWQGGGEQPDLDAMLKRFRDGFGRAFGPPGGGAWLVVLLLLRAITQSSAFALLATIAAVLVWLWIWLVRGGFAPPRDEIAAFLDECWKPRAAAARRRRVRG